jgi:hypothetical protein
MGASRLLRPGQQPMERFHPDPLPRPRCDGVCIRQRHPPILRAQDYKPHRATAASRACTGAGYACGLGEAFQQVSRAVRIDASEALAVESLGAGGEVGLVGVGGVALTALIR